MPKKTDLTKFRTSSLKDVTELRNRFKALVAGQPAPSVDDLRWFTYMTAVELHAIWERYAEGRLVVALNHSPAHFLAQNSVKGVKKVPAGLAEYVVRGGSKYFNFRSIDDLNDKANKLLSSAHNPFAPLTKVHKDHLDSLASVRNLIVHKSDAAKSSYKTNLGKVFGFKSAPSPGEFLDSIDHRTSSPCRGQQRIWTFFHYVKDAINKS
ncbi:MAG TPA: hypothetical protein VHE58_05580 [Burkholderiales bacterium]|nr:hypothetical protein [Burkholderiales bacterium]